MNKFIISAIVCAGGLSRRMGDDNKVLLPFKNNVIISHVVEQLIKSNVSEVVVVLGFEYEKTRKTLEQFGARIKIVNNMEYESGQTSSIKAGLSVLDKDAQAFMICMGDMPLLTAKHFNSLINFYVEKSIHQKGLIVRPMVSNHPGHPVMMDQVYLKSVKDCREKNGCRSVIEGAKFSFQPFESTDEAFIKDIDTPDSYKDLINNYS